MFSNWRMSTAGMPWPAWRIFRPPRPGRRGLVGHGAADDESKQGINRKWLRQVRHRLELVEAALTHAHCRDHNSWHEDVALLERAQHVPPSAIGQVDVQEEQVGHLGAGCLKSFVD